jgi:hypothetical protein
MEKLKKYGIAAINVLSNYVSEKVINNVEEHLITDVKHGHFQVLRTGWIDENNFKMGIILHFQIKQDGKIWILANYTEDDVAQALIDNGVIKSDIVLGFQPAYIRPYSGYAIA